VLLEGLLRAVLLAVLVFFIVVLPVLLPEGLEATVRFVTVLVLTVRLFVAVLSGLLYVLLLR